MNGRVMIAVVTGFRRRHRRGCRSRARQRASALVESLLAAPIVLLLGLGALQWALLLHARSALEYALLEAARAGSVAHAQPQAIEEGLARGLLAFWQGGSMPRSRVAGQAAAQLRLAQGISAGWIDYRQLAPTQESFADWAEPALDEAGYPLAGSEEIPNDNLQWSWLREPAGGIAAMRGREPIGAQSQQTLNDANLLKLELRYGVPLAVPFVGTIAAWIARTVQGCDASTRRQLGPVDLGTPEILAPLSSPTQAWVCRIHQAPAEDGRFVPRWPVRVSTTIRMQSAVRRSAKTPSAAQAPVRLTSAGGAADPSSLPLAVEAEPAPPPAPIARNGEESSPPDIRLGQSDEGSLEPADGQSSGAAFPLQSPSLITMSDTGAPASPRRIGAGSDGSGQRDPGWLAIGGERTFSVPGACQD